MTDPRDYLPLKPNHYLILLSLEEGFQHAYAIKKNVYRRTGGATRLGPGTLHRSLDRLLESGLIRDTDERPEPDLDDQRRRYYELTDLGRTVAHAETERLAALVRMAREAHRSA